MFKNKGQSVFRSPATECIFGFTVKPLCLMIIDWNKLQPYKTTKAKSFEQLCYQIASRLYVTKGTFTPIDDSGGGDGIEFYLTMADGSEWGWQAKYHEGSARLSLSGRKAAIISSLERALNKHPKMEIWFLCLATDLTPDEETWVSTSLKNHIPTGHPARIEIWNESFLHEKINQPSFNGLKQSFFNELELSDDWFIRAFEKSFSIVKNKFDDLLYVTNEEFEHYYVRPILCDDKFVEQRIAYYPRKLEELLFDAKKRLESLHYTNNLWRPLMREYIGRYSEFNLAAENLLPVFKARLKNITPNNFEKLIGDEYENEITYFESIKNGLEEFRKNWQQNIGPELTEDQKKSNLEQSKKIWPVESVYKEFIDELKYYVSHSSMPVTWRSAHYLGNGGDGKTNFAVALVKEYLSSKIPAIYIPAIEFTGANPLSDQILTILDIKSGYTFGDFLDCLDELGKIYNKRIPVVIDGLNEAINVNGFLNDRLRLDLPQMETDFLHRKNLVLLTTCRTTYKDAIWPEVKDNDKRFHSLYGFTNQEDKKRLVRNYFSNYKIQADLSFLSLERFTKPLYLKLFCESVNSERKNIKQVTLGFDSIYSIFENFVSLCDDNILKRIKKAGKIAPTAINKKLASKVLSEIAARLWREHKRAFSLDDLMNIADGQTKPDYKDSVTKALLDEELLFIRNWHNGEEYVFLTYDLMAGYFIAKHLVDTVTDFKAFFKDQQIESLIGDDYHKLHPNHEDITDGLCSLLPIKKGIFVHDMIAKPGKGQSQSPLERKLFERSITATILLSPEYITTEQVEYFNSLSSHSKNLIRLIGLSEEVLFVSNHPFNFKFWSAKLAGLPLNERDVTWSEYLRALRGEFLNDLITEFEALQTSASLTMEQNEKIHLVADYLKWTFTSTNKDLKGKAGDALYQFAIKFPLAFLSEFYSSANINDPSVFEWMMVILYNACIYLIKNNKEDHKKDLLKLSVFLQKEVLNPGGTYNTNHLVTRNYAYSILKLLVRKLPEVVVDIEEVRKNFKNIGIITWEEAEDLNKGEYRDGNALIDYHFNKEKMPYISLGRGNEYNPTSEYLAIQAKLRWRAYQLGYKFELFGEPDIQIARYSHWGEEFASTERYADKYIEIAFLEYCGYLDGLDDLESFDDIGYLRTFKLKYDPSDNEDADELLPLKRFVERDFINADVSLSKWCTDHTTPDVSEYLERTGFQEKTGNWVLLHCLVHQHKKLKERQIYFKVDTFFVRNEDLVEARLAFSERAELGRANNSIPCTNNIHECEIPDADCIPYNEFIEWNYSLESEIVDREYTKIVLIKNGKRLQEKESDRLWDTIIKQLHFLNHPRTNMSGFSMPMIRLKAPGVDDDESLEDAFKRLNIELEEEKFTQQELREIDKTIDLFIPVRYHKDKVYLCKNMIDELELSSPYGITDLNDQNEELASFNYTYEVEYVDQETFTYLRKDLLDKYLKDNELTMFQIIWGERDYYPIDGNWDTDRKRAQARQWAPFYHAVEYKI